ncbi:MAG TPA: peptidase M14, partial [Terriglobales bacterium]|nr:peptidase M14 [Terriglobales bacterium]
QNALGYNAQRASWNFPDPWRGGEWRLRDIVDYQLIAYEACLHNVAQNREQYVRNFYQIGLRAVNRKDGPYAFVVPTDQHDPSAAAKMLDTLRFGQVEINWAKSPFVADGIKFPADTWVILLNQPYGSYAKTLLERQKYPDLREYPGGPPKRPYDVTAQTLPLLMGVKTYEIAQPFEADLNKANEGRASAGDCFNDNRSQVVRAWVTPNSNASFAAINRAMKAGASVVRLAGDFRGEHDDYPAGTFVVTFQGKAAAVPGMCVQAGAPAPPRNAVAVKAPRIGIYASYQPSMDEGWTRWLLDQFEFPYTQIHDKDVRAGNLNSRFDVIIIPDQNTSGIVNGLRNAAREGVGEGGAGRGNEPATQRAVGDSNGAGRIPEEFTGGIGISGVEALKLFVTEGGTLITLNGASNFAIERLGVGARNVLQGVSNKDFYGPGSILRVNVDTAHPLAWGMEKDAAIWFEHSPAFAPSFEASSSDVVNVATYPAGNPLMSGWLLGDQLLQGHSALVDAPLGAGHVVMFGFRPQYRGQSYGTFKLLFNALYYFGDVAQHSAQPRTSD